jgi:hypothetical protein
MKTCFGQTELYSAGLLRFWKGRFFVRLQAEDETAEVKTALMALGERIALGIPQDSRKPSLLSALPPQGLIPPSVHYFHASVSLSLICCALISALGRRSIPCISGTTAESVCRKALKREQNPDRLAGTDRELIAERRRLIHRSE